MPYVNRSKEDKLQLLRVWLSIEMNSKKFHRMTGVDHKTVMAWAKKFHKEMGFSLPERPSPEPKERDPYEKIVKVKPSTKVITRAKRIIDPANLLPEELTKEEEKQDIDLEYYNLKKLLLKRLKDVIVKQNNTKYLAETLKIITEVENMKDPSGKDAPEEKNIMQTIMANIGKLEINSNKQQNGEENY